MQTIAVLGTLDTKGEEHAYVARALRTLGFGTLLIDIGGLGAPQVTPDITRDDVAAATGLDLAPLIAKKDRGAMVSALIAAAPAFVATLAKAGRIHGIISLGGTSGTAIGTAAMGVLPLGFPKVMVSTVASGNVAPYVGVKDIVMIPAIVDVSGLNRLSRQIFDLAAGALAGMLSAKVALTSTPAASFAEAKPLIVASMFGNTTRAVERARCQLEAAGYEVLVFHATGIGGRTMESLIESGLIAGVFDLTTTEWADEWVGGVFAAGPLRLEAAARLGVPAIIAPGCLDMVNFGAPESVPAAFAGRTFYQHNPQVTLMRTTAAECAELGRILAAKINLSTGPVTILLPLSAISVISAAGQPFHDPAADTALFTALKQHLRPDIEVIELDVEINAPAFSDACVSALLTNIARKAALAAPAPSLP